MIRALSLHIGLNIVDPNGYGGWSGELNGCINDAYSMQAVAESRGCAPLTLLNDAATAPAILNALLAAAGYLVQGDYFMVTFSGHGGRIDDGGIGDGQLHDTWVAYDRMIFDVELHAVWTRFAPGVRIVFASDSCHSGTLARSLPSTALTAAGVPLRSLLNSVDDVLRSLFLRTKLIPSDAAAFSWNANLAQYCSAVATKTRDYINATLVSMAACADAQEALDGNQHGLFTQELLTVWNDGAYVGNYPTFMDDIGQLMPDTQTPQYRAVGAPSPAFEGQGPFTVDPPAYSFF